MVAFAVQTPPADLNREEIIHASDEFTGSQNPDVHETDTLEREKDALINQITFFANALRVRFKPDEADNVTRQCDPLKVAQVSGEVIRRLRELAKTAEGQFVNVV